MKIAGLIALFIAGIAGGIALYKHRQYLKAKAADEKARVKSAFDKQYGQVEQEVKKVEGEIKAGVSSAAASINKRI